MAGIEEASDKENEYERVVAATVNVAANVNVTNSARSTLDDIRCTKSPRVYEALRY